MSRKHRSSKRTGQRASRSRNRMVFGAVLIVALIAVAGIYFGGKPGGTAAPAATSQAAQSSLPLEISVADAYAKYPDGAFFLDVREPSEWDAFHIPGATLIPLGELPNRLDELPRDRPIVVVCNSGNRSRQGRDTLLNAGFTDVTSMTGGTTGWSNAGYPIDGTRP
jgi:rhodanese-related sulfurtransferase